MKTLLRWLAVSLVSLFAATASLAQSRFSQAELDQMLAPIALYPDNVLSQLLMAATYPREIGDAANWSRANPQLAGEEAVMQVEGQPWDPSVKSLVAFPQILWMMADRMDWTQRLGEAFQTSPEQVSDTIQGLRRRADQAGTLRSGEEMKVYRDDQYYYIEPPSPEVVYLPYYDPNVAYGRWWWPSYQPIWWRPWPGYSWLAGYNGFAWGFGYTVGSGFFYSGWNWPSRHIYFHDKWPRYHRGWDNRHGHRWWHDRNRVAGRPAWHGDGRRHDGDRSGNRDGRRRDGDGRWDGRNRDGDRDGRWDGRSRDGDRDGRGDGRRRDGDGDGRNRDGRRSDRGYSPSAPVVANPGQVTTPAQSPVTRATSEASRYAPRVNSAAPTGRGFGHAPAAERPQVVAPQSSPVVRQAPAAAPASSAPPGRSAPSQAPASHAPASRPERASAPAPRESRSEDRGGGRGNHERSRDR